MRRCIVWDIGQDYEKVVNQLHYEILKGNMQIEALISRDYITNVYDGFCVVSKEYIHNFSFDYVIICNKTRFPEIKKEAVELGIEEEKIINGKVFELVNFDFKRYYTLLENPISILSNDCWAGKIYHTLEMKFSSPTINIRWETESFLKFVLDLEKYLALKLECVREADYSRNEYPIARIGGALTLHFIHAFSFHEAELEWERRKKRINFNNIFIKLSFDDYKNADKYLAEFDKIKYNKVCFYLGDTNIDNVTCCKRFYFDVERKKRERDRVSTYIYSYSDWCQNTWSKSIDILKLLNNDREYIRDI